MAESAPPDERDIVDLPDGLERPRRDDVFGRSLVELGVDVELRERGFIGHFTDALGLAARLGGGDPRGLLVLGFGHASRVEVGRAPGHGRGKRSKGEQAGKP